MAGRKAEMKRRLVEQRDRLLVEIEALRNKVVGLEMAIALLDSEDGKPEGSNTSQRRSPRASTKRAVLDLLKEVGTTGLNAATAVEIAERRGAPLDRGSVSSLLSRLKRDGVLVHDGEKYRLAEFAKDEDGPGPIRVVHGGA